MISQNLNLCFLFTLANEIASKQKQISTCWVSLFNHTLIILYYYLSYNINVTIALVVLNSYYGILYDVRTAIAVLGKRRQRKIYWIFVKPWKYANAEGSTNEAKANR